MSISRRSAAPAGVGTAIGWCVLPWSWTWIRPLVLVLLCNRIMKPLRSRCSCPNMVADVSQDERGLGPLLSLFQMPFDVAEDLAVRDFIYLGVLSRITHHGHGDTLAERVQVVHDVCRSARRPAWSGPIALCGCVLRTVTCRGGLCFTLTRSSRSGGCRSARWPCAPRFGSRMASSATCRGWNQQACHDEGHGAPRQLPGVHGCNDM